MQNVVNYDQKNIPGLRAHSAGSAFSRQNYYHYPPGRGNSSSIILLELNFIICKFKGKGWAGSSAKHQQGEREGGGEGREGGEEKGGPHAGCSQAEVGFWAGGFVGCLIGENMFLKVETELVWAKRPF